MKLIVAFITLFLIYIFVCGPQGYIVVLWYPQKQTLEEAHFVL